MYVCRYILKYRTRCLTRRKERSWASSKVLTSFRTLRPDTCIFTHIYFDDLSLITEFAQALRQTPNHNASSTRRQLTDKDDGETERTYLFRMYKLLAFFSIVT